MIPIEHLKAIAEQEKVIADLLEACKTIASTHDPRHNNNPEALLIMLTACRDVAKTAIAKAEGKP